MTAWRLSAAACPIIGLGGGWGAWLIIFLITQMSEPKHKTDYFDETLKRVHIEVVDSSSDEESIGNNVKKSKVLCSKT